MNMLRFAACQTPRLSESFFGLGFEAPLKIEEAHDRDEL